MINKTKDYDLFKFRNDNREKIDQSHVKRLVESIKSRNLLELRPIVVNADMEIMDGQHRLLAAKQLNVEIYYQLEKKLDSSDIIRMNINKNWSTADYLNFHYQHKKPEYVKLKNFMKKHNISLNVAIAIVIGEGTVAHNDFKEGKFTFDQEDLHEELDICLETIDYIKKMNGYSRYTNSARFWKALLKLVRHPDFQQEKWRMNFQKLNTHFSVKGSCNDYVMMLTKIYNWRNGLTINLLDNDL